MSDGKTSDELKAEYKEWQANQQAQRKQRLLQKKRAERKERARAKRGPDAEALRIAQEQRAREEVERRAKEEEEAARQAAEEEAVAAAAAKAAQEAELEARVQAEVQARVHKLSGGSSAATPAPEDGAAAAAGGAALVVGTGGIFAAGGQQQLEEEGGAGGMAPGGGGGAGARSRHDHVVAVQCMARGGIARRAARDARAAQSDAIRKEVMREMLEEQGRAAAVLQARMRGTAARHDMERRKRSEEAELEAEIRREIAAEEAAATDIQRVGRGYVGRRVAAYLWEMEDAELRRQLAAERAKAAADNENGENGGSGPPLDEGALQVLGAQSVWAYRYGSTPARDLTAALPRMPGEEAALHANPTALLASVRKTGRVRVLALTWNLHAQPPPEDMSTLLPRRKFHIYAIGTEECERSIAVSVIFQRKKAWEAKLRQTLGDEYVMLMSHTLQAIHMIVYVHSALLPLIDNIESSAVATGLGNHLGNKGGIGISFRLGHTSILFMNCHLAAGQKETEDRHKDALKINTNIDLPRVDTGDIKETEERATDRFDRVVWMGDFNYRVELEREEVDDLLARNKLPELLKFDQLQQAMGAARPPIAFRGMAEAHIKFPPTYKFDPGTLTYDTSSKQRVPSWTDRVLYKEEGLDLLAYNCCQDNKTSDHLPVYGLFNLRFEHSDNQLKDADEVKHGEQKSQVCAIM